MVPARLELTIEPTVGEAPLEVELRARLVGELDDLKPLACPSLAWVMGSDGVLITLAEDCDTETIPRQFSASYTYSAAGSYDAVVRLIALEVPASNVVQVLVRGPTPTPQRMAAAFGPMIVVATPAAPVAGTAAASVAPSPTATASNALLATPVVAASRTPVVVPSAETTGRVTGRSSTAPPMSTVERTATEVASAETPIPGSVEATATGEDQPPASGVASQVLPADLYYLARETSGLWVLPATGGVPRAVTGPEVAVEEYAVSASGLAACVTRGDLGLVVPDAETLQIAAGASSPVWSRDGRRLAYGQDGVWVYDTVGGRRTNLALEGRPLAFSRDGTWLLAASLESVSVYNLETGSERHLGERSAGIGGWLTDRDVVWLADPGLHLVTLRETLLFTTLLETGGVSNVFVRPDLKLLAWTEGEAGWVPNLVDLAAPVLSAVPFGPESEALIGADFSWAPDGRHGALADESGLALFDPATGASVPLSDTPAREPQWVLSR